MSAEKFSCIAFMLVALVGVLIIGTPAAKNLAILAAITASMSQYVIQDHRQIAQAASIALAYTSLILLLYSLYLLPWQAL